ncbi:cytochrome P450 [Mycena maculata]|uniref:Cytochrome P450 n=1 Tax=Mycena maculata TaxID=230809 RepID=A0AAD7JH01_9AGAR|nr:cytochrome P450 [Mycena maculata]
MATLLARTLIVLCAVAVVARKIRKIGARDAGFPPGPPTLPIVGNLYMFPKEFAHYKFTEWARQYGGIYSLKLGPGTAIVLTDAAAVKELMDKRSATTSDRPPMHIGALVTGGLHLVLARYGDTWRTLRRTAHAILTPQATSRHLPIQLAEATQLLHDILRTPQGFYTHVQRYSSSVIFSVLYGKRAPRYETPETTAFFQVEHEWELLMEPGATPPVDMIPLLKLVPERWSKWKRDSRRVRALQRALYFGLLDETAERVRKGEHNGSYMEEVLARQEEFGMNREMTGYLAGVLIEAASETTSSYLNSLILALVAYPDAQKKAHEEIDRVVGQHRMPTLDDLGRLPYVQAIILETHRFRPVLPLLVPHATIAVEEYQGYIIPEGATIFINAWGIFHDPALFDSPEDFIPDRYLLTENGTKPGVDGSHLRSTLAFGAGRRFCSGGHLAQNAIKINAMNLLWAFDFNPAVDSNGRPIKVDTFAYSKGATMGPSPFKCNITPRSKEKAEIIEREFLEAADTFSKFEFGLNPEDQEFVTKSRAQDH